MVAGAVGGAGVLALAGCGQVQLGAAAIYDNQRITTSALSAQVTNLSAAYHAERGRLQLPYGPAQMPGKVLGWMLRFATVERLAQREGIVVTAAQAQRALAAEAAQLRASGDTLRQAAILNGLPPDLLPELGRWIAIQDVLERRLDHGVPPASAAGQQRVALAVGHLECLAAKSLEIRVNPQFGAYDYGPSGLTSQAGIVPAPSTLVARPGVSGPPASPRPQLAPRC